MKINKQFVLSIALLIFLSISAKAQENVSQFLNGSLKDANILGKAYLEPFGKSLGTSLNSGWFTSAKPHKLGGFDITFTVATTIPPSSAKTFDVNKLKLDYWKLQTPTDNIAQTVTGAKETGPTLVPQNPLLPGTMDLPKGAGLKFIPAPIIQAGIGLPFNTELDFRYLPKIDINQVGSISLWGFGIKNEFKEFIPGFKAIPFNLSAFFGYTKLKSSFDISAPQPDASKDQTLDISTSGYTAKLLISKSIPVLTVYAGVGYNKSTTDVKLKGEYSIPNYTVSSAKDPISLDFSNSGMNANVGMRIKLAIIAFNFDYTFGSYKLFNAGVGINFR